MTSVEEQQQRAERGDMTHMDSLLGKRRRGPEDDSILNKLVKRVVVSGTVRRRLADLVQ